MITLDAIHPDKGSKYSPNLYKWLSNRRELARRHCQAFSVIQGETLPNKIVLGRYYDDDGLIGSNLNNILWAGNRAESYAFGRNPKPEEIENFWQDYERIGRCILDLEHKRGFVGDKDRWEVSGETRSCLWCNDCVQRYEQWEEVVKRAAWRNAEVANGI